MDRDIHSANRLRPGLSWQRGQGHGVQQEPVGRYVRSSDKDFVQAIVFRHSTQSVFSCLSASHHLIDACETDALPDLLHFTPKICHLSDLLWLCSSADGLIGQGTFKLSNGPQRVVLLNKKGLEQGMHIACKAIPCRPASLQTHSALCKTSS